MTETGFLVAIISMVGVNAAMLGLVLKVVMNGKPKIKSNPGPYSPEDVRLGDVSLAYFNKQVDRIIEAIKGES